MMKKILVFVLFMVACLGLCLGLASCGGDENGSNNNDDASKHSHISAEAVRENIIEATCTTDGSYDEVVKCSVCGEELSRENKVIAKAAHSYVDGVCSDCGAEDPDFRPSIGSLAIVGEHNLELTIGSTYVLTVDVPENVKKYLEWKVSGDEVTIDSRGIIFAEKLGSATVMVSYGELFDAVVVTVVAPHVHTPAEAVHENIVEATCTDDGSYDEVVKCSVCGEELSRVEKVIEVVGHVYVDGVCSGCGAEDPDYYQDYAGKVKFDSYSGRAWTEASVKTEIRNGEIVYTGCIDGDTTHFKVDESIVPGGILKARYIAINTPNSTGQIEPWGKAAAEFTKEKLQNATSIILESDTGTWNFDSSGERTLVWVWYKTAEMEDYRCLNIELLQEGLAWGNGYTDTAYGEVCGKALAQAMIHKLYIHDKTLIDPDFYYGDAQPITLKELKVNIEKYVNTSVAFEGVVVFNDGNGTAYVEEYDEETGEYFGIQLYYGYGLSAAGKKILTVGNRIVVAGSVQYYVAGDTYQISDIYYDPFRPGDPNNIRLLETGHSASYGEATVPELTKGKLDITVTTVDEDSGEEISEVKSFDYGYLALHSTRTLKDLTIVSILTTTNGGDSDGAHSITCRDAGGNKIVLRTEVLYDEDYSKIPASYFPLGTVIEEVRGIVDCYDGKYLLKVFHQDDIVFGE